MGIDDDLNDFTDGDFTEEAMRENLFNEHLKELSKYPSWKKKQYAVEKYLNTGDASWLRITKQGYLEEVLMQFVDL